MNNFYSQKRTAVVGIADAKRAKAAVMTDAPGRSHNVSADYRQYARDARLARIAREKGR